MNQIDLVKKIIEADTAYYDSGYPILSDQEYDGLKELLKQSDSKHPLLSKVGNKPKSALWKKASHQILMGSLNKVNTQEEFESWISKIDGPFILEPKLDGLSLSMVYEGGVFEQAITRGDGIEGEDISANVRNMRNFREKLNEELSCIFDAKSSSQQLTWNK
jgi:DNA ligase (NAD+)